MRRFAAVFPFAPVVCLTVLALVAFRPGGFDSPPKILFNDNLEPAGRLTDGVLDLQLELRKGAWHLLGDEQPGVEMLAFAETGGAPVIPSPMVRVPLGTEIHVSVTNPLDVTLVIHGLSARRVEMLDSLVVEPRSSREVRFPADAEGTFYYWATTTGSPLWRRAHEDSQLSGAFIVDPPDAEPPADRVMVMGIYFDGKLEDGQPDFSREFLVINGRPWPHTERLTYEMGDSIRWRIVNASMSTHPMHLHGFFYRVDARGDMSRDTLYWPAQRRMAVTERMNAGTTLSMVWSPDRPGGWIFHCHLSWHVIPNPMLGEEAQSEDEREAMLMLAEGHGDPNNHVVEGMGGLMMAMYVTPPEGWEPNEPKRRQHRLLVQSDSSNAEGRRQFGYVLQEGDAEPARDSVRLPGSTLVLWEGEPTGVWVVNRTDEPTQVHWHGLEIESYFDGVTGVGGYPTRLTPVIMPGDSFEMRITPPRAGSYMYHTHVNDIRQQTAGLYAAFIVLEEGEPWDPETDHIFLFGDSPETDFEPVLNGSLEPPPLELSAGVTHRFRFMNVTVGNPGVIWQLLRNGAPVRWRLLAKDGFDVKPAHRGLVPAVQNVSIGETYDFEFRSRFAGEYVLEIRAGRGRLFIKQVITVVEDQGATEN